MKTMQSSSLRKNLFKILDQISRHGDPIEILRHGKPIAVLGPSVELPAPKRKPLINFDAIAKFCRQHQITKFFLFGSILRNDFDESSDVDVLIDTKGRHLRFSEECGMLDHLEALFGRKVDLLTKEAIDSPTMNPHLKTSILPSLRLVYDETT